MHGSNIGIFVADVAQLEEFAPVALRGVMISVIPTAGTKMGEIPDSHRT